MPSESRSAERVVLGLAFALAVPGHAVAEREPTGGRTPADAAPTALVVTTTADRGAGSLRQAILAAAAGGDATALVTFDPEVFAEPRTIELETELPELAGRLVIDGFIPDRLWRASGVTVSGAGRHRVFRVGTRAEVTLRHLTVAHGKARSGGGIANRGRLVVQGVTFLDNRAEEHGGGLENDGGSVAVVNSTFAGNRARRAGGGFAHRSGTATVTNCTFSDNAAARGAGLDSGAELLLRNTILANSADGEDCAAGGLAAGSLHNLIETHSGCGEPISTADPHLQALGHFNGPTRTLALLGGSQAINLGDNASAVDTAGERLVWDQRGPGDPRFVGGYTDIGAFEHQRLPILEVDTVEDNGLRGCTASGQGDCPLRGAIELANASADPATITFDPRVFAEPRTLRVARPLPAVTRDLTLDAKGTGGVVLVAPGDGGGLAAAPGVELRLVGITPGQEPHPRGPVPGPG
jgi:hypothetical protein